MACPKFTYCTRLRTYTRAKETAKDAYKFDIVVTNYPAHVWHMIFYGFLDSMWQTYAYCLIGTVSNDPAKLAVFEELIVRWQRAFNAGQLKDEPNACAAASVLSMPPDARLSVLDTWKSAIRKTILEEICTPGKNRNECQDQLSRKFGVAMVATLTRKRIIGCTTTGAAKFGQDSRAAKPDVLVMEEAGEILESHVLIAIDHRYASE
jgi:hypothetical protein